METIESVNAETLLPWGEPKVVQTKLGLRILRKSQATSSFWTVWKSQKEKLKKEGVSVSKDTVDNWEVCWWVEAPEEITLEKSPTPTPPVSRKWTLTPTDKTKPLPRILALLGCEDHGPCDQGASACCPHCGADGRYVYSFLCEDGTVRGAMAGCLGRFPKHKFASKIKSIMDKERKYRSTGWKLPTWDVAILDAGISLADKKISFQEWEAIVFSNLFKKELHRKKYGK